MKYFIGVVTPDNIKKRIISFQKGFKSNRLPLVVEPHITVKSPGGLTGDLKWIEKAREDIKTFPRFEISFIGVDTFEKNGVVFLSPVPTDKLIELHKRLFTITNVAEEDVTKYFEGEQYHPHLTLAGIKWGISKEEVLIIKLSAEKRLTDLPKFNVEFVRVFKREDGESRYEPLVDIPLALNRPQYTTNLYARLRGPV